MQLEDLGLELFFSGRSSLYLTFRCPADRNAFAASLRAQPALKVWQCPGEHAEQEEVVVWAVFCEAVLR